MEKYVKELQKDFMPEDTKAGQIEAFLEKYEGTHVCTKMLFCEALEHAAFEDIPTWVSREIGEIMDGMDGWTSGKTHRFEKYGRQRHGYGLKNVNRVCQRIGRASLKYRSKWKYPLIDVNKETGYRNAVDSINTAKSRVSGNCQQCQRRF